MRKDSFLVGLIKWGCWSFVAGVGIANVLGPQPHEFMLKMWMLCSVFFLLSGFLFFAHRDLVRYTLIPAVIVLGLASYQWRFDTSNPNHIKNFKDKTRWASTVIEGTIVADPDVREWITHVVIKPEKIIEDPDSDLSELRELTGKTGYMILFVSEGIEEENPYYRNMEFGDRIRANGAVTAPMQLTNPYGFDYEKYLKNRNIYASMYVGEPEDMEYIEKSDLNFYSRLKKSSFKIKKRMILGLKKTVPPPASAFIGGVTVGARGGVPEVQKFDFQATGVAHVLALSGLHVGFLAIMLIMVFNNFFKSPLLFYKLPSKIFRREIDLTPYSLKLIPLFVIFVLFIFTIITGARAATIRAAMMFSIGIIFANWLGMNLNRAGSLTIPMAAAIMLSANSFLIYDASFALSFAAVWSIIYLSGPLRQIFTRIIVGWGQLVFFIFLIFALSVLLVSPWLFVNPLFNMYMVGFFGLAAAAAYFFEKKFPLIGFEFEGWWPFITGFFCVQLSIQIGMMWPLSGLYFNRFPVAGMIANFIAIPLIGIIVPLGLIGQLFTFWPGVGEHIGLAIGATNNMLSNFFLWMARFFRTYFPYPIQSAPPAKWLATYYIMVVIFGFNRSIRNFLSKKLKLSKKGAVWGVVGLLIFIFSSVYWAEDIVKGKVKEDNELLITFLDVAYGNCILIQTPQGKNMLIDAGARGDKRFWTMGKWGKGSSVVIPNLSGYNISKLDKVIVSNPLPENIGGMIYLLEYFNIDEAWDSLDPEKFTRNMHYRDFLEAFNDVRLLIRMDQPLSIGMYLNYYDFLNMNLARPEQTTKDNLNEHIFKADLVAHKWAHEGTIIHREEYDGKVLKLEAINPPAERFSGTGDDILNNSLVLKLTYGEISFLIPSNIQREGEYLLVDKYGENLKSSVLVMPDHGSSMASSERFLRAVNPVFAVAQYGYLKGRSFYNTELDRTIRKYDDNNIKTYRTDKMGAVEMRTDGKVLNIDTVVETF
ncbi:MAG: ComEC/Rec2 family competence protein [Elusimicrobia bacterium]|jgi:beta-lactamase superfamily II metal-dependent hydrolase/predicted membrane metal-binding protein|nr:ComEC/Rec2 family competence protein [Elusimicrobiota bacterium]